MTDSPSPATLLEVLNAAPAGNTALLIPETGARVSYESLRRQVAQAADIFASAGIQRGDRVAMALPNGPAVIVSFLAASVAGTAAPLTRRTATRNFVFTWKIRMRVCWFCPPRRPQTMPRGAPQPNATFPS
jgi:oxalate---CoA ligase